MKTCKNCGASINDDSRFCTSCGADTFADAAEEQTVVNAEASAQPATDEAEATVAPETEAAAPEESSGVYYAPVGETTESAASTYTYAVPADQVPVGKGKQKGRGWAIVLSIIVILGILVRFGVKFADVIFDAIDNSSSISEGYVDSTAYINESVNLKIDVSNSDLQIISDSDLQNYFNMNPDNYEAVIYDYYTGDAIVIFVFEGNSTEVAKSVEDFTRDEATYWYEDETNYEMSDIYEREIAGKTYTCIDITQIIEDEEYGDYTSQETLCVLKSGSMFIEIQVLAYPDDSGHTTKQIIDQYFTAAK